MRTRLPNSGRIRQLRCAMAAVRRDSGDGGKLGLLLNSTRAPERATRFGTGRLPILKRERAVHEDMSDADRILVRLLVGGPVGDRTRIEDRDVGEVALLD